MLDYYYRNNVFVADVTKMNPADPKSMPSDGEIVNSESFRAILSSFLEELKEKDTELYDFFSSRLVPLTSGLIDLTLALLTFRREKVVTLSPMFQRALEDGGASYLTLASTFFDHWLSINRFAIIDDTKDKGLSDLKPRMLFFRKSLWHIYNTVKENIQQKRLSFETDYSAGFVAGFGVAPIDCSLPKEYICLAKIPFVSCADLNLPYATRTKSNKRIGVYQESVRNEAAGLSLDADEWIALPVYVGTSLAYLYFNFRFLSEMVGVLNLFEKADLADCRNRKPDLLVVYGGDRGETTGTYFVDKANDLLVGYVSSIDAADYFGYVKKLVLTLHNIRMIKSSGLPLHGSMVNILMKNGREANVVIMGDSGAGKSESIEAFRKLADVYLKDIRVIFDDMGTLYLENGQILASGTETGAFVRLDDLDFGYVYSHLSGAVIYNLGEVNSRLVYRCTPYEDVIKKWKVDIFLYANNYEQTEEGIRFFDDYRDMIHVAVEGKRKAKGTTGEIGLVSSYFANPFGPLQNKKETEPLIERDFKAMADSGIKLGVIYTQLAVDGKAQEGPKKAAQKLLDWINNEK